MGNKPSAAAPEPTPPAASAATAAPAHAPSSIQDFQVGVRVRSIEEVRTVSGTQWAATGDEGVVTHAPYKASSVHVRFDGGYETSAATPSCVVKIGPEPWAVGSRVRAVTEFKGIAGSVGYKEGEEGEARGLPVEGVRIGVAFGNKPSFSLPESLALAKLLIIGPEKPAAAPEPTPPAASAGTQWVATVDEGVVKEVRVNVAFVNKPTFSLPESLARTSAATAAPVRKHNRWGDGLDAPSAGARDFFPPGWTPCGDVYEAIKPFGHPDSAIARIKTKGERLQRELSGLGVPTDPDYAAAVYAYTEEDPDNDLYGKLNAACRTPGIMAEKRLAAYLGFIHHLDSALTTLPSFMGRVYRGTDFRVSPASYAVGKTVTWQQFASASRSQRVARKFVTEYKGQLSGSYFICDVKNGKEVDALSAFPAEEEVLLKINTFFSVTDKLEGEAAKKAALPQLAGYNMEQLEVYVLKQL